VKTHTLYLGQEYTSQKPEIGLSEAKHFMHFWKTLRFWSHTNYNFATYWTIFQLKTGNLIPGICRTMCIL
jgi:geranylgeranyl pyrophosphate synthase